MLPEYRPDECRNCLQTIKANTARVFRNERVCSACGQYANKNNAHRPVFLREGFLDLSIAEQTKLILIAKHRKRLLTMELLWEGFVKRPSTHTVPAHSTDPPNTSGSLSSSSHFDFICGKNQLSAEEMVIEPCSAVCDICAGTAFPRLPISSLVHADEASGSEAHIGNDAADQHGEDED